MAADETFSLAEGPEESDSLAEEELTELDEAEPEAEPVSYAGTDFDVEGLVRRLLAA